MGSLVSEVYIETILGIDLEILVSIFLEKKKLKNRLGAKNMSFFPIVEKKKKKP